jgi:CheY-like chemotaxis protein
MQLEELPYTECRRVTVWRWASFMRWQCPGHCDRKSPKCWILLAVTDGGPYGRFINSYRAAPLDPTRNYFSMGGVMPAKTILVIEDDDATRADFGKVLEDNGYTVKLAANGNEGLDYLQNQGRPDLIILDMLMPDFEGWRFLHYRNNYCSSVPVLIVTAMATGNEEWAASLGACCWLSKPIDGETLVTQVQKCLACCG